MPFISASLRRGPDHPILAGDKSAEHASIFRHRHRGSDKRKQTRFAWVLDMKDDRPRAHLPCRAMSSTLSQIHVDGDFVVTCDGDGLSQRPRQRYVVHLAHLRGAGSETAQEFGSGVRRNVEEAHFVAKAISALAGGADEMR